jgi:phosphate uptake regulator
MKRKVLLIGKSSLAVSLPSKWAKGQGIKPGDEVTVDESEGGLRVSSGSIKRQDEFTIRVKNNKFFRRMIISPYVQGFERIVILFEEPEIYSKIVNTLPHLMGFEIVEEKQGRVVLQNVAEGLQANFDVLFKRLSHLVITIGETLKAYLEQVDEGRLSEIDSYELMTNRLHNYCRRILNLTHSKPLYSSTFLYSLVTDYEYIADLYKLILKIERESKSKKIVESIDMANKSIRLLNELLAKPSIDAIIKFNDHHDEAIRIMDEVYSGEKSIVLLQQICAITKEMTNGLSF